MDEARNSSTWMSLLAFGSLLSTIAFFVLLPLHPFVALPLAATGLFCGLALFAALKSGVRWLILTYSLIPVFTLAWLGVRLIGG